MVSNFSIIKPIIAIVIIVFLVNLMYLFVSNIDDLSANNFEFDSDVKIVEFGLENEIVDIMEYNSIIYILTNDDNEDRVYTIHKIENDEISEVHQIIDPPFFRFGLIDFPFIAEVNENYILLNFRSYIIQYSFSSKSQTFLEFFTQQIIASGSIEELGVFLSDSEIIYFVNIVDRLNFDNNVYEISFGYLQNNQFTTIDEFSESNYRPLQISLYKELNNVKAQFVSKAYDSNLYKIKFFSLDQREVKLEKTIEYNAVSTGNIQFIDEDEVYHLDRTFNLSPRYRITELNSNVEVIYDGGMDSIYNFEAELVEDLLIVYGGGFVDGQPKSIFTNVKYNNNQISINQFADKFELSTGTYLIDDIEYFDSNLVISAIKYELANTQYMVVIYYDAINLDIFINDINPRLQFNLLYIPIIIAYFVYLRLNKKVKISYPDEELSYPSLNND